MDINELPKQYDPAASQRRWAKFWEENHFFESDPNPNKKPYTIVIPPPNVTGALHLGHALNDTLQDIMIRSRRMQGFETLWVPGVDHAGIATQATVEKRLFEREKKTRHDIGREALVQRIWECKDQYQERIIAQLKALGCSCDWRRTRFTLDPVCAKAVRHFFFKLFSEGLIYRGKRLVNWDTHLQTAVSDDEVFHTPIDGHFWYLHYPVIDPKPGEPEFVTVATTRPETMLGDTAVAVHPEPAKEFDRIEAELRAKIAGSSEKEAEEAQAALDALLKRREELLPLLVTLAEMAADGRQVTLPLMNRPIPLVRDVWAKPELGTGCVKITPAHDPNDYEVGKRQNLPMINLLERDGRYNANAGKYAGLPVKQVREKVLADLEELGLLVKTEDRTIEISMSDRSKTPIEPFLNDQWFIKMEHLAQTAMDAVEDGSVTIHPSRYAKGYLDWLSEKRDWPIGRQLWWGHRIPIWYCDAVEEQELKEAFAGREDISYRFDSEKNQWWICSQTEDLKEDAVPGHKLIREEDVLDTWFSSALWPHSVLGWPDATDAMGYYYPTSLLITSRDIITLWVARMVLASYFNTGKRPFKDVFIHPKILDKYGEGMSKTKGNGIDPVFVIEKFGADSLRFAIAYLTTESQDVRLSLDFECPYCGATVEQTKKNRTLPKILCPKCRKEFSTQWAETDEDKALARGPLVGERFEVARNFCNKLWNASRFVMMNLEGYQPIKIDASQLLLEDRWILSRLAEVIQAVTASLESFRFSEAARALYDFAWDEFCSFYLEMIKGRLFDQAQKQTAQTILVAVLDTILRLLHPITPFVTEEVWQRLKEFAPTRGLISVKAADAVCVAPWPTVEEIPFPELLDKAYSEKIASQFAVFQEILRSIREARARQNVPPKTEIHATLRCEERVCELLEPMRSALVKMAGAVIDDMGPEVTAPPLCATVVSPQGEVYVDIAGLIDIDAEIAKKEKEIAKIVGFVKSKEAKLAGGFAEKAPAAVVEKERQSLEDLKAQLASNEEMLAKLRRARQ
ncbi:MAG: valine--tRNA ligase [Thermoguttaceae bacterium]|nr:valine--tRNA ligase [Thermoguttaceae bacterium]